MRRLLKLFSDLPIARKLLLASVIPILTVILLSIVTYRSVENFSEDESELNTSISVPAACGGVFTPGCRS